MSAYELYTLNEGKGYEFIGFLPERRRNPIGITRDAGTNWGKTLSGDDVDGKNIIFRRVTIDCLSGTIVCVDLVLNNN